MDKMTRDELLAMSREIDNNYAKLELPVIEPKYKDGKLTNEKELKKKIKLFLGIAGLLWANNLTIINKNSKSIQTLVFKDIVLKMAKKSLKTGITKTEWNEIIAQSMKDRAKKIKINQVIKGNVKRLNRNLQKTVISMYKEGKSKPQIAKALQKELGYNKAKAKQIATTEVNYYKSNAQLKAISKVEVPIKKIWVYNKGAKEPREHHQMANGQVADKNGYFTVGGKKTTSPQHFGDPAEDIYCHCSMQLEFDNNQ